jgi:hypothetical protein
MCPTLLSKTCDCFLSTAPAALAAAASATSLSPSHSGSASSPLAFASDNAAKGWALRVAFESICPSEDLRLFHWLRLPAAHLILSRVSLETLQVVVRVASQFAIASTVQQGLWEALWAEGLTVQGLTGVNCFNQVNQVNLLSPHDLNDRPRAVLHAAARSLV